MKSVLPPELSPEDDHSASEYFSGLPNFADRLRRRLFIQGPSDAKSQGKWTISGDEGVVVEHDGDQDRRDGGSSEPTPSKTLVDNASLQKLVKQVKGIIASDIAANVNATDSRRFLRSADSGRMRKPPKSLMRLDDSDRKSVLRLGRICQHLGDPLFEDFLFALLKSGDAALTSYFCWMWLGDAVQVRWPSLKAIHSHAVLPLMVSFAAVHDHALLQEAMKRIRRVRETQPLVRSALNGLEPFLEDVVVIAIAKYHLVQQRHHNHESAHGNNNNTEEELKRTEALRSLVSTSVLDVAGVLRSSAPVPQMLNRIMPVVMSVAASSNSPNTTTTNPLLDDNEFTLACWRILWPRYYNRLSSSPSLNTFQQRSYHGTVLLPTLIFRLLDVTRKTDTESMELAADVMRAYLKQRLVTDTYAISPEGMSENLKACLHKERKTLMPMAHMLFHYLGLKANSGDLAAADCIMEDVMPAIERADVRRTFLHHLKNAICEAAILNAEKDYVDSNSESGLPSRRLRRRSVGGSAVDLTVWLERLARTNDAVEALQQRDPETKEGGVDYRGLSRRSLLTTFFIVQARRVTSLHQLAGVESHSDLREHLMNMTKMPHLGVADHGDEDGGNDEGAKEESKAFALLETFKGQPLLNESFFLERLFMNHYVIQSLLHALIRLVHEGALLPKDASVIVDCVAGHRLQVFRHSDPGWSGIAFKRKDNQLHLALQIHVASGSLSSLCKLLRAASEPQDKKDQPLVRLTVHDTLMLAHFLVASQGISTHQSGCLAQQDPQVKALAHVVLRNVQKTKDILRQAGGGSVAEKLETDMSLAVLRFAAGDSSALDNLKVGVEEQHHHRRARNGKLTLLQEDQSLSGNQRRELFPPASFSLSISDPFQTMI